MGKMKGDNSRICMQVNSDIINSFSNKTSALGEPLDTTPRVPAIPLPVNYVVTFYLQIYPRQYSLCGYRYRYWVISKRMQIELSFTSLQYTQSIPRSVNSSVERHRTWAHLRAHLRQQIFLIHACIHENILASKVWRGSLDVR